MMELRWRVRFLCLILATTLCCIRFAVGVDPNLGKCSGNAVPRYDTCPRGMYCDEPIGGTCQNCSYCNRGSLISSEQPLKCRCDSLATFSDPARICIAPLPEYAGRPVFRNCSDIEADGLDATYYCPRINGTLAANTDCPAPTTLQPTTPATTGTTSIIQSSTSSVSGIRTAPICAEPQDIPNGSIGKSDDGRTIRYSCRKGYILTGNPEVTCNDDGRYVGQLPECKLQDSSIPSYLLWPLIILSITIFILSVGIVGSWLYRKKRLRGGDLESYQTNGSRDGPSSHDVVMLSDEPGTGTAASILATESDPMIGSGQGVELSKASTTSETDNSDSSTDNSDSSPRVSSVESAVSSVHAADLAWVCGHRICTTTWKILEVKMHPLLLGEEFKEAFVSHLFRGAENKPTSRICVLNPDNKLFESIVEEVEIYSLNYCSCLGETLACTELRELFPSAVPVLDELLRILRDAHDSGHGIG